MQPNYFPKIKDKNFLNKISLVKVSNEFCSTCQWSWTDSWLFLSSCSLHLLSLSRVGVFFCCFNESSEVHWLQPPSWKIIAKLREEGQARGRRKRGNFFSLLPRPLPLFWSINLSLGGRRRLVLWFALQNTPALQATIFFLQIVSIKARDPFFPFLEPTHPQEQSFFDLVEYYFNIMIVNKFLLHDGKSMVLY